MLEKQLEYFIRNQSKLVKLFKGKYIVIVGEEVVGAYNSTKEAYIEAQKEYELGNFMIQYCDEGEDVYTVNYHYKISFNGKQHHTTI